MNYRFNARMVENGKVIKETNFETEDSYDLQVDLSRLHLYKAYQKALYKAYKEAHEGINPYSSVWVEITPCRVENVEL